MLTRYRLSADCFLSPFLTVAEWVEEYGPAITIRLGYKKIVIIGRTMSVPLHWVILSRLDCYIAGCGGYHGEAVWISS
jgi:hypothetical protein